MLAATENLKNLRVRYLIYKSYLNLQSQFKQTKIGFLWDPLSLIFVTTLIASLWYIVLDETRFTDFYAYVLGGYFVWTLVSSIISSSSGIFIDNRYSLTNEHQPLEYYSINSIVVHTIRFILVIPIVVLQLLVLSVEHSLIHVIVFFLAVFFILLTGLGLGLILGTVALFIPDIKFFVSSIMRLAFLLTPIIWKVERLGEYQAYIYLNPIYPFIEVARQSLTATEINYSSLVLIAIESIVILLIGIFIVRRYEKQIRTRVFRA